jgi:hypothetical protein
MWDEGMLERQTPQRYYIVIVSTNWGFFILSPWQSMIHLYHFVSIANTPVSRESISFSA